MNKYQIIQAPVDTEKTTIQKEQLNQVAFSVNPAANRVQIDPDLCVGCGTCVPACPVGAIVAAQEVAP